LHLIAKRVHRYNFHQRQYDLSAGFLANLQQFSHGCILSFLVGASLVFALPSSPKGDYKDRPYSKDTGNCKPL